MNIRQIKEVKNTPRLLLTKFVVGDEHGVPVRHNLQWVIVEDRHLPVSIHKPLNLREDCDYVSRAPFIVDYMFDVPKTKQNGTVLESSGCKMAFLSAAEGNSRFSLFTNQVSVLHSPLAS